MPAANMERISIGLLENTTLFVRGASSTCNGNHFLVSHFQAASEFILDLKQSNSKMLLLKKIYVYSLLNLCLSML